MKPTLQFTIIYRNLPNPTPPNTLPLLFTSCVSTHFSFVLSTNPSSSVTPAESNHFGDCRPRDEVLIEIDERGIFNPQCLFSKADIDLLSFFSETHFSAGEKHFCAATGDETPEAPFLG